MNFLFPTLLFGLIAIAIPIIIHLFNFRRYKKVYFTNVQFLKEIKQESDSISKIKELLILAMRILAITCLVFAFAQPYLNNTQKKVEGEKVISIYIDNSFSMESTNKKGTLLENAKQHGIEIVNTFMPSDKFQLLTNDFEGKHQRFYTKEEFLEQLNDVKISSASKTLSDVLKRQQDFLQNSSAKVKRVFLLSDFQKNETKISRSEIDTNIYITFIPITSAEKNNVFIDSVWFEAPVQEYQSQQKIHVTVINKSAIDIDNGSLKLFINEKQVSLNSFNISSGNKTDVSISFTIKEKGINNCIIKIEDYPITYDDNFYFSFDAQNNIHSLVINGKDSKTAGNFKSLMQNDSLFVFNENTESTIDYSLFGKKNIIVLNELTTITSGLYTELQKFVISGGSVVIFPNIKSELLSYNEAFKNLNLPQLIVLDTARTKTQSINYDQGLYQGVFDKLNQQMDLPKVLKRFELKKQTTSNFQNILVLQNGSTFLSQHNLGKGKIYLFSSPSDLSCTNLLKHALFVPTLIKMSILSLKPAPLYYKTATNETIDITSQTNFGDKPLHIINHKSEKESVINNVDIIPEHRVINNSTTLFTQNQITNAGHYQVMDKTKVLKGLAFNYDRKESSMDFYTVDELQKQIFELGLKNVDIIEAKENNVSSSLQNINDGNKLWKLFLLLTLLFLLAEIIIIRVFR